MVSFSSFFLASSIEDSGTMGRSGMMCRGKILIMVEISVGALELSQKGPITRVRLMRSVLGPARFVPGWCMASPLRPLGWFGCKGARLLMVRRG